MGIEIEVEPVRAGRWDCESARNPVGLQRIDHRDLGWISNVHMEFLRIRIVDCPSGPARHWDLRSHCPFLESNNGQCVRARYGWVPDIRNEDLPSSMIVGKAIGADTNA